MEGRPADRRGRRGRVDRFSVRPATAGGWDHIIGALARLLARLAATGRAHCVVVDTGGDDYVQCMVRPDGTIWGEVGPGPGSGPDAEDALGWLGWRPPDPDGRFAGNRWQEWPACQELVAATAVGLTCLDAFGAGPRSTVRVEVFEAVGAP